MNTQVNMAYHLSVKLNDAAQLMKNTTRNNTAMKYQNSILLKTTIVILLLIVASTQGAFAQHTAAEQEVMMLSKNKWQWMADKNVEELAKLFDDRSKFVHMSGTWNKARELEIIESGSIWYKQADVHDVVVEIFGDTAVLWNRITLLAVVRGNEVSNQFTVTEIYQNQNDGWKMLDLTFSSVRDTHTIDDE